MLAGIRTEIETMREALVRLVRVEEQMSMLLARDADGRDERRRLHDRVDALDARCDELDKRLEALRGPLAWLAGIAATVVAGAAGALLWRAL